MPQLILGDALDIGSSGMMPILEFQREPGLRLMAAMLGWLDWHLNPSLWLSSLKHLVRENARGGGHTDPI